LLPLLGTAAEQDHQAVAVLRKIDAIARPVIDPAFEQAGTDSFDGRKISSGEPNQCRCDLCRGFRAQPVKPDAERAAAVDGHKFPDLRHNLS
jgi:hypothetical protein